MDSKKSWYERNRAYCIQKATEYRKAHEAYYREYQRQYHQRYKLSPKYKKRQTLLGGVRKETRQKQRETEAAEAAAAEPEPEAPPPEPMEYTVRFD